MENSECVNEREFSTLLAATFSDIPLEFKIFLHRLGMFAIEF